MRPYDRELEADTSARFAALDPYTPKLMWDSDVALKVALYPAMEHAPDPHGQAALMLCDGLMLLLIEAGVIDKDRALEVIEGIIEVKQEIAGVRESVVVSVASIGLLKAVARSLAAARGPEVLPIS